jgi:hypothetical protein
VKLIKIDTLAPQVQSVFGHVAGVAGAADGYVDFTFRVADRSQSVQFAGATVTVNEETSTDQWYVFVPNWTTGIRGIEELQESYQYRTHFNGSSFALTNEGTVTVTVSATDSVGNNAESSEFGVVTNPSALR